MTRPLNDAERMNALMRGERVAPLRRHDREMNVLAMLRQGLDTCAIDRVLEISEAEAANRLHAAREAERGEPA